jgi:hypothetical protein
MKLNHGYQRSSIIQIIIIVIFFTSTYATMKNDQMISFAHIPAGKVQDWKNIKDNIKVQFAYFPEKPIIDTFTALNFSVQDLKTGEHIDNYTARVVVTNGQRLFKFENITVPNGDFSVKYLFPDDGTHQVILRVDSNHLVELASFQVFVPHQSPPSLLNVGGDMINILIAIIIIAAVGLVVIRILKKK